MAWFGQETWAQRPFALDDPFYRSEQASRIFFDGYALSMDLSYRPAGAVDEAISGAANDPLALRFRFDYQLLSQLDLGLMVDALGNSSGRSLALSWVTAKYYWGVDHTSYALRLAVDPSLNALVGFPQVDVAFISTTAFSPFFYGDFALGVRRVRLGVEQLVPTFTQIDPDNPDQPRNAFNLLYSRALGYELHLMNSYSWVLGKSGSNLFASLIGEAGKYELLESPVLPAEEADFGRSDDESTFTAPYRGGVIWARFGMEINRPSFQVIPFVSLPAYQWTLTEGSWDRVQPKLGFRFLIR
ncbi:MAG: hypothetical protein RhofKO_35130 [Rhodothermales bacterium]